ncbi:MAG: hypothetical protein WAJ88_09265, partial [Pseudolabrys sp.]
PLAQPYLAPKSKFLSDLDKRQLDAFLYIMRADAGCFALRARAIDEDLILLFRVKYFDGSPGHRLADDCIRLVQLRLPAVR